jgi:hypothetical protein
MDLEGNLTISFKPDPTFSEGLKSKGTFQGEVLNREHIGLTGDELVQMWNDNHPEDPVVSPEN